MSRVSLVLLVLLSGRSGAQTFFFEGFETAGFMAVDGGFTQFNDADPVSVFSWTGDAGVIRGAQALVVQRTMTTGSGPANSDLLRATFPGHTGTVSVQTWLRLDSSSGFYGAWPVQLHGVGNPGGTNAEILIRGSTPSLQVQTGGRAGFRPCTPTMTLPDAGWHLLELITTGNGTDAGLARGYIDGVPFCESANDWSGYPVGFLLTGTSAYERAWAGTMVLDELRVADGVLVDRLEVTPGALAGTVGDCLPLTLDTGSIDDAGALDRTLTVDWAVTQGAVALSSAGCTDWDGGSVSTNVPLSARTVFGVKLVSAGPAEVQVVSAGLLGGATLRFNIEPLDAGSPDAGLMENDAGRDPQRLAVGCSCSSASDAAWSLWVLALFFIQALRESGAARPTPR
ncbi:MAG: hypothetical protein Q8N23_15050 [Archangium sp.]|nr:hypothetical protein [Archangium sp.]MDP3574264.1 hypothetical protein [Archangium sp.]